MGVPVITTLFKKQQVSHVAWLISSRDPVIHHCATQMTVSEQKKQRTSFKTSFKPMLMARDALVMDPGMTSR